MSDEELKALFEGLRQENAAAHAETRRQVVETRQEVVDIRQEIVETRREVVDIRQENAAAHVETRQEFKEKTEELKRHFDVTAERMEKKFETLAETVMHLDQKLTRETADIRAEMRTGFAETQAMIKFSHMELDRRIRTLEEGFADLQSRLERLESSTH